MGRSFLIFPIVALWLIAISTLSTSQQWYPSLLPYNYNYYTHPNPYIYNSNRQQPGYFPYNREAEWQTYSPDPQFTVHTNAGGWAPSSRIIQHETPTFYPGEDNKGNIPRKQNPFFKERQREEGESPRSSFANALSPNDCQKQQCCKGREKWNPKLKKCEKRSSIKVNLNG